MYQMDETTNDLLSHLRSRLGERASQNEESRIDKMSESTLRVLSKIRTEMDGSPGESMAYNDTDADEAYDLYLDSIVERLTQSGSSESDAEELVFLVADDCEEKGLLPPMPGTESTDDDISLWLGMAKTAGFTRKVLGSVGL